MKFKFYLELTYNGDIDKDSMQNMLDNHVYRMTLVHDVKAVCIEASKEEGKI
jgi:hypothetical protein